MYTFIFDLDDTLLMSNSYQYYDEILPNHQLIELLNKIHIKYIYSNGNSSHVLKSLENMQLYNFNSIFTRSNIPYIKPHCLSLNYVNNEIKKNNLNNSILFFDDLLPNLKSANNFNWITIWISNSNEFIPSYVNYKFNNIMDALNFFI